ncbi:MAG: carboxypeptidase regulatory-like domain-containing protein, partial [Ignavibacteria bacterium]
ANVLITTQNDNILTYKVEKIEGTSKLIEIPVEGNYSPNFYINAAYVNNGSFYNGSKSVMVIPESKFLNVLISTDKPTYKPKEEGTLLVKVSDNNGNPVSNSEVSIGIVDESIYAIKQDNTKDVRKFFYSPRLSIVSAHYNNTYSYYGYSRLITIYERFNIRSLSETELGTVKGRLTDKNGNGIPNAMIIIDGDFVAGSTGEDGSFEFKMPAGSYSISVMQGKKTKESDKEISVDKGQTITVNLRADKEGLYLDDLSGNIMMQRTSEEVMDGALYKNHAPKTESRSVDKKEKSKGEDESDFVEAELRSDFKDAIYWSPSVETDANGYATVKVQFPDNLTTWRITSRVITGDTKV